MPIDAGLYYESVMLTDVTWENTVAGKITLDKFYKTKIISISIWWITSGADAIKKVTPSLGIPSLGV